MSTTEISQEIEPYLLDQLRWRYATKSFDATKKIAPEQLKKLEDALQLAPSSYGLQPYKIYVVSNDEVRQRLRPAAHGQAQITDASHLVVFAANVKMTEKDIDDFIALNVTTRKVPPENLKQYRDMMVGDLVKGPRSQWIGHWTARQCYIALGLLLTTAALLKIDACPMEGFDPDQFDEILGLKEKGLHAAVLCALGFRAPNDWLAAAAKVRKPKETLIERV